MKDFIAKNKWILLSGSVVIIAIVVIVLYNLRVITPPIDTGNQDLYPTPYPISSQQLLPKASEIQKTTIGRTTKKEVEQLPELLEKTENTDGSSTYTFTSPLLARPERIITKNDRVIFESILTPESPNAIGYASVDDYVAQFGQPEAILQGSKFYGWHMQGYVYASKGFTLIVNPFTQEVFEIHVYQPMTTDNYVKYYGDDITPDAQPPSEH